MQDAGFVGQSYILQKRIEWDPKLAAIAFMGQLFGGVYSEYTSAARPDSGPVYGDPNESLTHRLGVELGYEIAQLQDWNPVRYPGASNSARPDLRATIQADGNTSVVHLEALTDHNNAKMLDRKRELMQRMDGTCSWMFENRQHATRALNYWCESSTLDLINAPYSNAGNHAFSKLNEYIARSKKNDDFNCDFIDQVISVPQLYDSSHN